MKTRGKNVRTRLQGKQVCLKFAGILIKQKPTSMRVNLLFLFILLSSIVRCQVLVQDCEAVTSSTGQIILPSSADAKKYIQNYRLNFKNKSETHTRAIYLNSKTILFLDSFFNKYTNYKGVSVHFSVYSRLVGEGQNNNNQFILYFTPTLGLTEYPSDYSVLNLFHKGLSNQNIFPLKEINTASYCPELCDTLTSNLGGPVPMKQIGTSVGGGFEGLLIYDEENLKWYKEEYRRKTEFMYFNSNRHTKSVYFKKEKIQRLASFIKAKGIVSFPAIGVYFMSYNKKVTGIGQIHNEQISLGFVPMRRMGTTMNPDFCEYNSFVRTYFLDKIIEEFNIKDAHNSGKIRGKSFENHSELCPDDCPPGEN